MAVITGEEPQIEPIMDSWTEANVVSSLSIVDQISVIKAYSKFEFLIQQVLDKNQVAASKHSFHWAKRSL